MENRQACGGSDVLIYEHGSESRFRTDFCYYGRNSFGGIFDGTKATAAEQSAEAIRVIKGFYLYVPIAIWVVMFVIAACYQLDKVYDKMMRELIQENRERKASVPGEIQPCRYRKLPETGSTWQLGRLVGGAGKKDCRGCCKSTGLQGLRSPDHLSYGRKVPVWKKQIWKVLKGSI